MFVLSIALGIAIAALRRVDLTNLATIRFRGLWLCFLALAIKIALFYLGAADVGIVVTYGIWLQLAVTVALAALIALNAHLPGMKLVLIGVVCNLLVIGLNDGKMPATVAALQASGQPQIVPLLQANKDPGHVLATDQTRLVPLADCIPVRPVFHQAFSPGDIVVAIGLAITVGFAVPSRKQQAARFEPGRTAP